jgi:hypothetical protein
MGVFPKTPGRTILLVQRIICFQSTAHAYKLFRARPNRIKPALKTSDTVH